MNIWRSSNKTNTDETFYKQFMQKSLNFQEHWDKEYESVSLINGKSAFHFNNVLNVEHLIVISYLKTVLNPSHFPFSDRKSVV